MPIDPNIALGYRGIEVPNPLVGMAQVTQIQASQRQGEMAQMQLDELRRDREEMLQFQKAWAAKGGNPDLNALADLMIKSPKMMSKGIELKQKLQEQSQFDALIRQIFGGTAPAAPTAPAAAGPTPITSRLPEGSLGSAVPGAESPAVAFAQSPPIVRTIEGANTPDSEPAFTPRSANALAPQPAAAAAPTNQLAAPGQRSPEELRSMIAAVAQSRDPRAKALLDMLQSELTEAGKTHNVAPGTQVMRGGKVVYTAPEKPSEFERSLAESDLTPAEKAAMRRAHVQKLATHPPVAGELTAAQKVKLRSDASGAQTAANTNLDAIADLGKAINDLRSSPGLSAATGVTGVYLPSFTEGEAAQAEVRLEALRGKITAFGKAAASQSGAIGSIANQEWKILADQVAAINPVKGKKPLLEQLSNLESAMARTSKRIQEAYADLYGEEENLPASLRALRAAPSATPASTAAPTTPAAAPASAGGFTYVGPKK